MSFLSDTDAKAHVHIISNSEGDAFDTFAYNTVTHDSLYYAFDPAQQVGRRSISAATNGEYGYTVSLFEDGTATVGCKISDTNDQLKGTAVSIDTQEDFQVLIDGELLFEASLQTDPNFDALVDAGLIQRQAANDLLTSHHWRNLIHLGCVRRSFPSRSAGTDGASYHVPAHVTGELGNILLEAGATPRPKLPLFLLTL